MSTQPTRNYTLDEYFELEKSSAEKPEYWSGNVRATRGASLTHNKIVRNLSTEIDLQLRKINACSVFPSDLRISVPANSPYCYSDLSALCGEPQIKQINGADVLINPQLIIEVLSDSTEAFDRGDKFSFYKSIPSFKEYLLIAQHRPHVTQFVRKNDWWVNFEFNGLSDVVILEFSDCFLPLKEIYRDVNFETL